jgi:hypothetical protein
MANANLKQNVDEFKVHNNAWFFHYDGIEVKVMKIPNFDYWAGVDGYIYSLKGQKLRRLKARDNGIGYLKVSLSVTPDESTSQYVHRLVAGAWLEDGDVDAMGNCRNEINHIDGVKANNKLCNLERCSKVENAQHLNYVLKSEDFLMWRAQRSAD